MVVSEHTLSALEGLEVERFGLVVAVVVPKDDEVSAAEVNAVLANRIARFKQPKIVVNVRELPRNAMGKVQKNQLRADWSTLFESVAGTDADK